MRRIISYPARFLLLAKKKPEVVCEKRQEVAHELLTAGATGKFGNAAAKVTKVFEQDLRFAADTGQLRPQYSESPPGGPAISRYV